VCTYRNFSWKACNGDLDQAGLVLLGLSRGQRNSCLRLLLDRLQLFALVFQQNAQQSNRKCNDGLGVSLVRQVRVALIFFPVSF